MWSESEWAAHGGNRSCVGGRGKVSMTGSVGPAPSFRLTWNHPYENDGGGRVLTSRENESFSCELLLNVS